MIWVFSFSADTGVAETGLSFVSTGVRGGVVASVETCFSDDPPLLALPCDEMEDADRTC